MRVRLEYHEICKLLSDNEMDYLGNEKIYTLIPLIADGKIVEGHKFPTHLRKMWSGGEVQEWIDQNINNPREENE